MKILTFIISIFISTTLWAQNPNSAYEDIKNQKAILIDVRESDETSSGYIKLANLIPLSLFETQEAETVKQVKSLSENKKIFLYCRSGRRSDAVKSILKKHSIESINLGGYSDLIQAGLPKH